MELYTLGPLFLWLSCGAIGAYLLLGKPEDEVEGVFFFLLILFGLFTFAMGVGGKLVMFLFRFFERKGS